MYSSLEILKTKKLNTIAYSPKRPYLYIAYNINCLCQHILFMPKKNFQGPLTFSNYNLSQNTGVI